MRCGGHGEKKTLNTRLFIRTHDLFRQVEQHSKEDYAKKAFQWAKGSYVLLLKSTSRIDKTKLTRVQH
jgi:hypothetical protein